MNWKKVVPLITIVIVLVVLFYVYKYVVKTREGFDDNGSDTGSTLKLYDDNNKLLTLKIENGEILLYKDNNDPNNKIGKVVTGLQVYEYSKTNRVDPYVEIYIHVNNETFLLVYIINL